MIVGSTYGYDDLIKINYNQIIIELLKSMLEYNQIYDVCFEFHCIKELWWCIHVTSIVVIVTNFFALIEAAIVINLTSILCFLLKPLRRSLFESLATCYYNIDKTILTNGLNSKKVKRLRMSFLDSITMMSNWNFRVKIERGTLACNKCFNLVVICFLVITLCLLNMIPTTPRAGLEPS